ncbi:MAG: HisA/HisF-related TIM barrel protein, partial [Bacteroidales bacterium]|nr:HisA/HisF-related TIM barrel protein [Bacteroidales bacterium]
SAMVLGADVRDGKVAVKGWLEDSLVTIDALIEKFLGAGLREVICTDISKDGMLAGPSFDLYRRLTEAFPSCVFTVSGGISSMADIERLSGMGLPKVIVGKAIYENRITLDEIEKWSRNV